MNTREVLEKIIDIISSSLERNKNKDYAYQSGAYEVTLQSVKKDLELINEILELQEKRIYP